jgi:uncharacterized repeat protein (TIGR01451 family)
MLQSLILALFVLASLSGFCYAEAEADLAVSVTDSQDPVVLGTNFNYVVTVSNSGPGTASSVILNDVLNANGTFQAIAAPEDWKCTSPQSGTQGSLTCTGDHLDAGKSATFTLTIKPTSAGMLTNTANITSPVTDTNQANNSDYEDTTVIVSPTQ